MLKPEDKRCYVCGSTKHMASECDRPKKDDPPPKGTGKGKDGKDGKGKGKSKADLGKGKAEINKVEAEDVDPKRVLKAKESDPKEPDAEPRQVELEQKVVKALKEKQEATGRSCLDDLDSIVDALTKLKQVKTCRIKKSEEGKGKRFGLIDSGATHNVREAKEDEEHHTLIPIEVEVAFDSEVRTKLFMTRRGTIVGPRGTETILSMHEVTAAGYKVQWNEESVEVSKGNRKLPVTLKEGTPILPNEVCLEIIEEIEQAKAKSSKKKTEDDFQLKDLWPQLRSILDWMIRNQAEGVAGLMKMIMCKRRKERINEKVESMLDQVKDRKEADEKVVLIELCCEKEHPIASQFKKSGGEVIRMCIPEDEDSKEFTVEALKKTIEQLEDEGFSVLPKRGKKDSTCEEKTEEEVTREVVRDIARKFLQEIKEDSKNKLEIEVIKNPEPKGSEDQFLMRGKLHMSEDAQTEDTDVEVSIKALRRRGEYKKEDHDYKPPQSEEVPWWHSEEKRKRAIEQYQEERRQLDQRVQEENQRWAEQSSRPKVIIKTISRSAPPIKTKKEEKEPSSSSSESESSEEEDKEIDQEDSHSEGHFIAPEQDKEIQSEVQSRGRDIPETTRPKVKLERNQRTSTTDQKRIPVKKDTARFARKIKPNEEIKSVQILTVPSEESYEPVWCANIPHTIEDLEKKEKNWKGFKYGLKQIGLDIEVVRKRLKQGKTPWYDDKHKEQIDITLQKNWMKFKNHPNKEVFTLVANERTTQAKSLPKKPDDRKPLERKIHAVKEEPVNKSSSSKPMTKEQQKREDELWRSRREPSRHDDRRSRKVIIEDKSKGSLTNKKRKRDTNFKKER